MKGRIRHRSPGSWQTSCELDRDALGKRLRIENEPNLQSSRPADQGNRVFKPVLSLSKGPARLLTSAPCNTLCLLSSIYGGWPAQPSLIPARMMAESSGRMAGMGRNGTGIKKSVPQGRSIFVPDSFLSLPKEPVQSLPEDLP